MNHVSLINPIGPGRHIAALVLILGPMALNPGHHSLAAQEGREAAAARHTAVAACVTETGTILRRAGSDKDWHLVAQKETLSSGALLVGLPGAMLDSQSGAVRLALLADLDELSPYPVKECAVRLKDDPGVDLALTLDRGRAELINRKDTGAARVRLQVRDDTWDLTLAEPGAKLALELYGRWPAGVPFIRKPRPKDAPIANLVFLVVEGQVTLKHGGYEHALKAPPGPALIGWDSVSGQDEAPQHLEKLPTWATATGEDTARGRGKKATIERFRQASLAAKSIGAAVDEFLNSDQESDRKLAIYVMGALDDLAGLGKALREAKHPDIWEHGVLALRHWIGRGPGQDQILYKGLIEVGKFKPVHAETVLQLLHSYGENELARPETYQTLIDYLDHDKLAIRGLAYWHLSRLVPAGREYGYNPLDPKEAREAAIQKWRKLIAPGSVPVPLKGQQGR